MPGSVDSLLVRQDPRPPWLGDWPESKKAASLQIDLRRIAKTCIFWHPGAFGWALAIAGPVGCFILSEGCKIISRGPHSLCKAAIWQRQTSPKLRRRDNNARSLGADRCLPTEAVPGSIAQASYDIPCRLFCISKLTQLQRYLAGRPVRRSRLQPWLQDFLAAKFEASKAKDSGRPMKARAGPRLPFRRALSFL